jgi:hypothetical protein
LLFNIIAKIRIFFFPFLISSFIMVR